MINNKIIVVTDGTRYMQFGIKSEHSHLSQSEQACVISNVSNKIN